MLDAQIPDPRVDEIIRCIREKVRCRGETRAPAAEPAVRLDLGGWQPVGEPLARVRDVAQVGAAVPAMRRMRSVSVQITSVRNEVAALRAQLRSACTDPARAAADLKATHRCQAGRLRVGFP